ncbi:hypothetical protein Gotur_005691 [Gossypium turneri]
MPDLSRSRVHLRWLLKLVDFRAAGELSWGSSVLATLYREMCGATRPSKAKIGGCLSLLQSRDPVIWAIIPDEIFQNPNTWHAKVALISYATVEMHQSDRLACVPEYMLWFRIHGKPYLLSAEERQRQLRVQREKCGPLNPRRKDDNTGPSTRPRHSPGPSSAAIQSPGPTKAPIQSPDLAVQPTIPTA